MNTKLYLQKIVESIPFERLPQQWCHFDLMKFSKSKNLYDYQQNALKHALIALYKYYVDCNTSKKDFFNIYSNNGFSEDLDIKLYDNKKIKIFEEYDEEFPIRHHRIPFYCFINRMSFWMATGSGKTLVIVKLLQLLGSLIHQGHIPKNDILFLTYREDLIEQFKNHVNEFNLHNEYTINLYSLKEYANVKRENRLKFEKEVDVFYYRSDLISDEQKDKIVNFRNYDNGGKWYILLDEAHKGDKEDSKRQAFYSILSRKGFLFNFSATFTDPIDYATCVYNFNLARFIEEGYGKHIYTSKKSIDALEKKDSTEENIAEKEKQKILLKILVLYTAIHQQYESIKKIHGNLYHKPLLLTLVNSVNTEDSDLELFFREIERIAGNRGDGYILEQAKKELINELSDSDAKYEFEETKINSNIIVPILSNITYKMIMGAVFNSTTHGTIEVIKIPGNKQELAFKLKTSDKPFALMKIGDISEWIKGKLTGYELTERFENESLFRNLNNSDDINILMGSRSFYEGWDSNRPNIILFINIGKGIDAKKFVLQSIGRGVRIEPLPNKRKRLISLYNTGEVEKRLFEHIKNKIDILESLFIFGTKANNLKDVIETLKEEKQDMLLCDLFEINPEVIDKPLLIPVYKHSDKIIIEEKEIVKFPICEEDYYQVKDYFTYLGDKIALCKFDCDVRVLKKIKEGLNGEKDKYFYFENTPEINNPDFLLGNIFKHFRNRIEELSTFKQLEDEIIHFTRISISKDKLNMLQEKIKNVKVAKDKELIKQKLKQQLEERRISIDEYTNKIENISQLVKEESLIYNHEILKIKLVKNHYYIPVALSDNEKIDFITHIIKHKSEVDFINQLEKYLEKENNFLSQCDWWYFSKIDETLDEVYIPYYQSKTNRIEKFKPDFIFWLKRENDYTILFIDPKSTEYTDAYRKIDGFSRIFEDPLNGESKTFIYNGFNITVKLRLTPAKSKDEGHAPGKYRQYWFDRVSDQLFAKIIQKA